MNGQGWVPLISTFPSLSTHSTSTLVAPLVTSASPAIDRISSGAPVVDTPRSTIRPCLSPSSLPPDVAAQIASGVTTSNTITIIGACRRRSSLRMARTLDDALPATRGSNSSGRRLRVGVVGDEVAALDLHPVREDRRAVVQRSGDRDAEHAVARAVGPLPVVDAEGQDPRADRREADARPVDHARDRGVVAVDAHASHSPT